MKLQGTERQLLADDCPLQLLAQMGQVAAEVQFILQRTGPSLTEGPDTPTTERRQPRPGSSEPQRDSNKAFSSSTHPRRNKTNRAWSASPRASPEPRASPVSLPAPSLPVKGWPASSSKEETFRQILLQQRRLQDLEVQLQSLQRETEERERPSASPPSLIPGEVEELEERLRQNEEELMLRGHWEEQLQLEDDRERGRSSNRLRI